MFHVTEQRLSSFLFLDGTMLLPEMYTIVRLHAPSLQSLVTGKLGYEWPFDARLGKLLVKTASQLVADNGDVQFAYLGRAEISLLFELDTHRNRRSPWSLLCTTASQASARLSLLLGEPVAFQAAVYQLPNAELVEEYFAWQQGLTSHCAMTEYYLQALRQRGVELGAARQMMAEMGPDDIARVLVENGMDASQIPTWQREGTGLYRQADAPPAAPLLVDIKLPAGDGFRRLVQRFLQ